MKDLIFETLLLEASNRVTRLTRKGMKLDEAISEVANDMALDSAETAELNVRKKKAPAPKPVIEDTSEEEVIEDPDTIPNNTIMFRADDMETVVGVLMYKGIPWTNRTSTSLTFANADDVKQAHEALKRRWDFINGNSRTVAAIEFDNLEDYSKVLDFISSKNMLVMINYGGPELEQDVDLELAEAEVEFKKARKSAKEQGLPAPEMPETGMSFSALRKDSAIDAKSLNPLIEPTSRNIVVSKRWK